MEIFNEFNINIRPLLVNKHLINSHHKDIRNQDNFAFFTGEQDIKCFFMKDLNHGSINAQTPQPVLELQGC